METIYLQDNAQPVIKLEPMVSIDTDSEIDSLKATTNERIKIGEIFQTSQDLFAFACAHCSAEFPLFFQFTSHIEVHLQHIFTNRIEMETLMSEVDNNLYENDIKPTIINETELEIDEPITITDGNDVYLNKFADDQSCKNDDTRRSMTSRTRAGLAKVKKCKKEKRPKKRQIFECFDCHKQFNRANECRKHLRNHSVTICQYCSQPTRTLKSLRLHRRLCRPLSADDIPTECFMCLQMFPSYRYYYMHAREEHSLTSGQINKRRKTVCKWCSLDLKTTHEYLKHKQWHKMRSTNEHKCDVCGKVFQSYNASNYKYHMQQHSGEKSTFFCDICNKEYALSYKMEHMRLHAGEKKFQCSQCGVLCITANRLRRHIKTHSTDRPFECNYCKKRFRLASFLEQHKRLHTGDFIHYCEPCKKGYTNKIGLKKHMSKVHGAAENGNEKYQK